MHNGYKLLQRFNRELPKEDSPTHGSEVSLDGDVAASEGSDGISGTHEYCGCTDGGGEFGKHRLIAYPYAL